jgi:hypothetical protein
MTFVEILDRYSIPYRESGHEHCRSGWLQIDCPLCDNPGHYRLGYNLAGRYLNCWSCGSQRVGDTLSRLTKLPWQEVKKLIADLPREHQHDPPKRGRLVIPTGVEPLKKAHTAYLRRRGLDQEEMTRLWGLQGIGIHPKMSWRIFIPFIFQGKTVSWLTRGLTDIGLRYISASAAEEELDHKSLLFGEDYARHAITIHEGPFDVFAVGPGAVATCGTSYSRAQLLRMSRYPIRAVCFDNESAAQTRAKRLCEELEAFPGETYRVVLDSKDAGAATKKEIVELRKRFL